MANNVFPLRVGEVLRAWYVARETGAPGAAIFGTVIVERVVDAIVVLGLAAIVLGARRREGGRARDAHRAAPAARDRAGAPRLRAAAALRARAGDRRSARGSGAGCLAGARAPSASRTGLDHLADGLRGLRGGSPLAWVAFYSLILWLVVAVIPFAATLWSLHIDLGSHRRIAPRLPTRS